MARTELVEWFFVILVTGAGLSQLLHPFMWARMLGVVGRRPVLVLLLGVYSLILGSMLGLAHNTWEWRPGLIVTVFGWAAAGFGVLYLALPRLGARMCAQISRRPRWFVVRGLTRLALAALLLTHLVSG